MVTIVRRTVALAAGATAAFTAVARRLLAQDAPPQPALSDPSYPFSLPPLPYATAAANRTSMR